MKKVILCSVAALAMSGAWETHAQDARNLPVASRPRPDYDPAGIAAGSFLIKPSATFSVQYDDNIFAQDNNKDNDYVFVLAPALDIDSNWNNHALGFKAGAELGRNKTFKSENYNDWNVSADGRLDVQRDLAIVGAAGYDRRHEVRGSPNDVGGREPTEFEVASANLGILKSLTRISMRASFDFRDYDYHDVPGLGAAIIDEDLRDRKEYGGTARVGYEFMPQVSAFVQGSYNWRRYDTDKPRNSDGYRLLGGSSFDLGGVTSGELFIGYRRQSYDNPAFTPAKGLTYGGSVLWQPTGLTSVELQLLNDVMETIQGASSGYVTNSVSVKVDHELLRNVLLGARLAYSNDDYKGISRNDDIWEYGVSARYLMTRNFSFDAEYRRITRSTNLAGADYKRNVVTIGVTAAL